MGRIRSARFIRGPANHRHCSKDFIYELTPSLPQTPWADINYHYLHFAEEETGAGDYITGLRSHSKWDSVGGVCALHYNPGMPLIIAHRELVQGNMGRPSTPFGQVIYIYIFLPEEDLFYNSWDMKFKYNKPEWKFIKSFKKESPRARGLVNDSIEVFMYLKME